MYVCRFDINRSTFDDDMSKKRFLQQRQICSPVTLVQRSVCTKLVVSTTFLFQENRRHTMDRQTERHTDEVQHLMQPTREGHIIKHFPIVSETKVCEECNRHTDRQISQKQSISNGEIYF